MPCWLLLLNDAGFPLFSRSYGLPASAFSFATMGLLSAVHSAAGNSGFGVRRLQSQDGVVLYDTRPGGLILLLASSDTQASESLLRGKLSQIYDALLFVVGRTKIQDLRNVERTKRQIRSAANLLSLFLIEDAHLLQMGTGAPEACIATQTRLFDDLRALAKACHTSHAALYAQHRMYVWTEEWASLDSRDLFTVSCFLRSCSPAQARDVPVYLAHSTLAAVGAPPPPPGSAGKTPYRLLTISLMHDLELVLLCGPTPSLMDAMSAAQYTILNGVALPHSTPSAALAPAPASHNSKATREAGAQSPMYLALLASAIDFPRHLPAHFQFHPGILGFIFVWQQVPESATTGSAQQQQDQPQRRRLVSSFLPNATNLTGNAPGLDDKSHSSSGGRRSPSASPRRGSGDKDKDASSSSASDPRSPSQFAPSNPLFSSSLLSEASVLSRSHALLCFYQLVEPQLFPPPLTPPQQQWRGSPPQSPRGAAIAEIDQLAKETSSSEQGSAAAAEESVVSLTSAASAAIPASHTTLARSSTAAAAPVSSSAASTAVSPSDLLLRATTTPIAVSQSPAASPSVPCSSLAPLVTDAYMLSPTRGFYACRSGSHALFAMFGEKTSADQHCGIVWQLMQRMEAIKHRL